MQTTWIARYEACDTLVIFVLGWASDPSMLSAMCEGVDGGHNPKRFDAVCLWDFRDMSDGFEIPANYGEVHLVAWSFGVWVAERLFLGETFASAMAVNGTPRPVDSEYGIPPRVFGMTVRGIEKTGHDKFFERMCDGLNPVVRCQRSDAETLAELRCFADYFSQSYSQTIAWSRAVVGGRDLIFPPQAQVLYWSSVAVELLVIEDAPHFLDLTELLPVFLT